MFRRIFYNTVLTAWAFLISGLVGLWLVPVLIHAYGVSGFGLIMLARMFMPTAGIGLLDFGISEIATQTVSVARADKDWPCAKQRLQVLLIATVLLGILVGGILYFLAPWISRWLHVGETQSDAFTQVVQATAVLLPLLFTGLIFEGILKGFEDFPKLRTIEVVTLLGYAAVTVCGVYAGWGYSWVAWTFVIAQSAKAATLGIRLRHCWPSDFSPAVGCLGSARSFVFVRGRLLFFSRIQSTLQHQTPTLFIGFLVGPAGAGLYDAITRLPRFAKSVLSILSSTLLPAASRLNASGDHVRLRYLGEFGLSVLPALVFPPLAIAALFSADLLAHWLGNNFIKYSPWLAVYWLVPALNTILSFQSTTLLSRPNFLRDNNLISFVQTVLQLSLSFFLVSGLQQNAFIIGQVVATMAVFAWQVRLSRRHLGLPFARLVRFSAYAIFTITLVVLMRYSGMYSTFVSLWGLLLAISGGCLLGWAISARWFLTEEDRCDVRRLFAAVVRR
jgi:O-antigen/teichoic acid export membrane protein